VSQRFVEQILGKLVADEGFRRRFARQPSRAIGEVVRCSCRLTSYERQALSRLDPETFDRFAETIDPSLLQADLSGGSS
jgi:hypothetical protein